MKRLIIIVEGETEKEFVDKVLAPYLHQNGIGTINAYKISKTNGGLRHYSNLRKDLVKAVNENNVLVTTLIDYYALPSDFPQYENAHKIANKAHRLECLEKAIINDIAGDGYMPHLMPYIQLHEFEALVFTSIEGIKKYFNEKDADYPNLNIVFRSFSNPEDINDSKETAPSKRLKNAIPTYNKVTDGNSIIEVNGINAILEKCPRFGTWVKILIEKINER